MKTPILLAFATVTLVGCEQPPTAVAPVKAPGILSAAVTANSAVTSTSSISVPIDLLVFVPCANGGAGEVIDVSGPLHIVSSFTISASGNVTDHIQFQPQGVSGTGLSTGAKYQATGLTEETANFRGLPFSSTFVNNFYMIGQGPGNNFKVHQTVHITVDANGVLTAFVDNFSVTCK